MKNVLTLKSAEKAFSDARKAVMNCKSSDKTALMATYQKSFKNLQNVKKGL